MRSFFRFPNPVNEAAARIVAGIVVSLCIATIASRQGWLLVPLAAGFWARVLTGPRLSPAAQFATRLAAPWIEATFGPARRVPGPPKRFAQGIGTAFSTAALVLWFAAGLHVAALVVVAALAAAAALECTIGLCLGCVAFGFLVRTGVLPSRICEECSDISGRIAVADSRTV
jgi:hypothetical protein